MAATGGSPALRFEVGKRVQCRTGPGNGEEAWSMGTIARHWYRESHWPAGRQVPYQIRLDDGRLIFAPMDDDRVIREPSGLIKDGKIPVTVLTGFLGSGKTTLLNFILKVQHGKKYAIIENEVGAVGVDNQLLKQAGYRQDSQETITLLDNGCLCCTVRGDLVDAIKNIVNAAKDKEKTLPPGEKALDGILIETTGLADPGPICKTFYGDAFVNTFCKIDGVITLVDCVNFVTQLTRERSKDAVNESAQQVAFADKVLLNKIDACDDAKQATVVQAIQGVNSFVPITKCAIGKNPEMVPLEELLRVDGFDLTKLRDGEDVDLAVCGAVTIAAEAADVGHGHGGHGGGHGGHGGGHGGHGGHGGGHGGHGGHGDHGDADCDEDHGHGGGHQGHGDGHEGHGAGHAHGHGHNAAFRHDAGVGSFVCTIRDAPLDFDKFRDWINALLEDSENLYRYKGIVACQDDGRSPVMRRVIQGVHDMCQSDESGEWPAGEPIKSQMVLIGRNLDRPKWESSFQACKMT